MTARQFLLDESIFCRQRATSCVDPFLAEELRRLADSFARTADAIGPEEIPGGETRKSQGSL